MSDEATVFVVEDDPTVLDSISVLLESADISAKTFASAAEFLDSFEPCQLGCLLVDVRLPGISGIDLVAKLRANSIDMPVIFMSGHAGSDVRNGGLGEGVVCVLEKPVDARQLIELLRATIADLRDADS